MVAVFNHTYTIYQDKNRAPLYRYIKKSISTNFWTLMWYFMLAIQVNVLDGHMDRGCLYEAVH